MPIDLAALTIRHYPDPCLRKACNPVERFDEDLSRLAARILELMREAQGVGLAAPQVGLPIRLFVCNVTGEPADDRVYVNPALSGFEGRVESEEGCLSIPEVTVTVRRYLTCTMNALDVTGKSVVGVGSELVARCWQHECDHLDGRLIIDHMSEADKIANRRTLRQLEQRHKGRAIAY